MAFKDGKVPNTGRLARNDFEDPKKSYKKFLEKTGATLREIRRGQGFSSQGVTKRSGISGGTISRAELGSGPAITLWVIWRLAEFYGYDVEIVLTKKRKRVRNAHPQQVPQESTGQPGPDPGAGEEGAGGEAVPGGDGGGDGQV